MEAAVLGQTELVQHQGTGDVGLEAPFGAHSFVPVFYLSFKAVSPRSDGAWVARTQLLQAAAPPAAQSPGEGAGMRRAQRV